ncbi:MAG TPA: multidrug efflux SMR transporter [Candidatus Corynebacterium avicola]|uniref:Spermidine export protein MdtJ n=1 Tax=Candidatus Corynebacterium avicola TaxID=2838527 RepID=A0A9D1UK23_9CORY|nr:multidrug efflux SMR transporter [Candidatus Corynebacterium avicola]
MTVWMTLVAAIVSEVAASLSLKAAMDNPAWYVVVVLGYLMSFFMLSRTLRGGMALGVAYGIWAASGVALTSILSSLIFGESMNLMKSAGIVLVIGGVLLVEIGSQKAAQQQYARQAQRPTPLPAEEPLRGEA